MIPPVPAGDGSPGGDALRPAWIEAAAARMRRERSQSFDPLHAAGVVGQVFDRWRDQLFGSRLAALSRIARSRYTSPALLEESIDALLAPFTPGALKNVAKRLRVRDDVGGFVMAGNLPGAGLHEFTLALISGSRLIVKTASQEPVFFAEIARTIDAFDSALGSRIAVTSWSRKHRDLTTALGRACDWMAVFGEDATLENLCSHRCLIGFGSRVSGALVAGDTLRSAILRDTARALARDVTLFDQRGCLSPHHVFVECSGGTGGARRFAAMMAKALDEAATRLPPPARLPLEAAAAVRQAREDARWRRLGGEPIELWEGSRLGWTVIFDPTANFRMSPGFRIVYVSPTDGLRDLERRLAPIAGHLEAFAIASVADRFEAIAGALRRFGASYVCPPGMMQSPGVDWPHGGGAMLRHLGLDR